MGRSSKVQKEERIERVLALIGDGLMTFQIVNICRKEWNISRRTVERYLSHIYKFLKTELTSSDKDKVLLEYDRLIQKYENKDSRLARDYRQMRDKITGISKERTDITSNDKTIETIILNKIIKGDITD